MPELALIAGVGPGLSAALARLLAREGFGVVLAARNTAKLSGLLEETGATAIAADVSDMGSVARLFGEVDRLGPLAIAVFNAAGRVRGVIDALDPLEVRNALMVGAYGAFLVGSHAARRMAERGSGTILFTGATASVKGFAGSAGFAMPKFAMRGLAQSMARELAPKNIHVAHVVIDGRIAPAGADNADDSMLSAEAIAQAYLALHRQPRSAWTWEIELRPWVEKF